MSKISISVIIPVYNVELYLEHCLDSILHQDFQEYEMICINDASTDSSGEILFSYAKKYKQIRVITHSENKGLSAARNTGLRNARGKYVMFVDSDDLIVQHTLVELYNAAEKAQVDILYFNIAWIYDNGKYIITDKKVHQWYDYEGVYSGRELFTLFVDNRQMKVEACRQFIRKRFLEEKKIEFYNGILHEDILFSFFCAMNAQKVADINKEYYIQRQRGGSITNTKNFKRVQSLFVIMMQILTYWNSHIFTEKENRAIEYYFRDLYNTYQNMSWFGKSDKKLEVGGYVEKVIYSIIHKEHKNRWITLDEIQLAQIEKAENVIIFGAGLAAMDIVNVLKERNIKISMIAVSNVEENPKTFCNVKVDAIDKIANYIKDAIIIVGVTEKYSRGVKEKLKELGFSDIIIPKKVELQ